MKMILVFFLQFLYVDHVPAAYPYKILQVAETVRSLGKPSLQSLFMTVSLVNDSDTIFTGDFLAHPDTQFEYDGYIEGVTKSLSPYLTLC